MLYRAFSQMQPLESRRLLADSEAFAAPTSLLADMNGDQKADLVGLSRSASTYDVVLSIGLGRGNGTFSPSDRIVIHANTGYAIGVGDLDGDGALDVAVAGDNPLSMAPINGTYVITAFGNGDGKFKRSTGPTAANLPLLHTTFVSQIRQARSVSLADLDNNGFGEVSVLGVARSSSTVETSSLVVNWDPTLPTFAPVPPTVLAFNSLVIVNQIHAGDLDGDGRTDLVLTNRKPLPPSLLTVVRYDLVTARFPTDHTAVVRQGGNPLNMVPVSAPTNVRPVVETFGLANLNGDAVPELIARRNNELRYASYTGGNTLFGPVQNVLAAGTPPIALTHFIAGDVTGDGLDDVIATGRYGIALATNTTVLGGATSVRWSRVVLSGVVDASEDVLAAVSVK